MSESYVPSNILPWWGRRGGRVTFDFRGERYSGTLMHVAASGAWVEVKLDEAPEKGKRTMQFPMNECRLLSGRLGGAG